MLSALDDTIYILSHQRRSGTGIMLNTCLSFFITVILSSHHQPRNGGPATRLIFCILAQVSSILSSFNWCYNKSNYCHQKNKKSTRVRLAVHPMCHASIQKIQSFNNTVKLFGLLQLYFAHLSCMPVVYVTRYKLQRMLPIWFKV